jgi:hypothetical protein
MRMLIAAMFKKVPVCKTKRLATLCKRCGAAIYSLSFLKAHLDAHNRKGHRDDGLWRDPGHRAGRDNLHSD